MKTKKQILDFIENQTGVTLSLCPVFTETGTLNNVKFFSALLPSRKNEQKDYQTIKELGIKYNMFTVNENGLCRIAIVTNNFK